MPYRPYSRFLAKAQEVVFGVDVILGHVALSLYFVRILFLKMIFLFSRPVRSSKEERQTEGHQPLRRIILRRPPQTGQHHGPTAPPHAGDRLRGHCRWR